MSGIVVAICICPVAGGTMQCVEEVDALAGYGLKGDRYAAGQGSFNRGKAGSRQVTLINSIFFEGSGFAFADSRRNIVTTGVELMWLVGRRFTIGEVQFLGVKYCDPCERPSKLSGNERSFKGAFLDRGGLIADVMTDGVIRVGDLVVPPPKGY